MEKFGWAFLGCGGIAHTVANQLKGAGDMEIVCNYIYHLTV